MLTSGKIAVVVDVNPDNPRYPIVQLLGARSPDGKELVVRTSETSVRVLRPLTRGDRGGEGLRSPLEDNRRNRLLPPIHAFR
jgi:hypothetical protein